MENVRIKNVAIGLAVIVALALIVAKFDPAPMVKAVGCALPWLDGGTACEAL